ncbi:hypothetical protein Lepto7376_0775 [[Leptolyngbya] sp. PCC 7376]|uniref:hypothetical protein n=1 Tax=[Leptolyngbya] sp. PCC 7376 TaxID=111781 RepID=UPI00029EC5AB|nr:hypothetical protein [[Leptolyngbya] sp. PCC 7376]AFY37172.1 hypothetical protein Lepto7376_0775 [[Leptolyngbya] sp. PCC 7376]
MSFLSPQINAGLIILSLSVLTLGYNEPATSTDIQDLSQGAATEELVMAVIATEEFPAEMDSTSSESPPSQTSSSEPKEQPTELEIEAAIEQPAETTPITMEIDEVGMMRDEALKTAISDNNLTPLTDYCYEGFCTEIFYTFVSLERTVREERLYDLEVVKKVFPEDDPAALRWETNLNPTKVLCSTERPLVIEKSGEYFLHHISGGSPQISAATGLEESDALYWDICHDLQNPDSAEIRAQAEQLGYDLEREPSGNRSSFIELFEE